MGLCLEGLKPAAPTHHVPCSFLSSLLVALTLSRRMICRGLQKGLMTPVNSRAVPPRPLPPQETDKSAQSCVAASVRTGVSCCRTAEAGERS